jgi:hypothetical protein
VLDPKTHRFARPIRSSPEDVKVLQDHLAGQEAKQELAEIWQETGWVFTTGIGTTLSPANLSRAFKGIIKTARARIISARKATRAERQEYEEALW